METLTRANAFQTRRHQKTDSRLEQPRTHQKNQVAPWDGEDPHRRRWLIQSSSRQRQTDMRDVAEVRSSMRAPHLRAVSRTQGRQQTQREPKEQFQSREERTSTRKCNVQKRNLRHKAPNADAYFAHSTADEKATRNTKTRSSTTTATTWDKSQLLRN